MPQDLWYNKLVDPQGAPNWTEMRNNTPRHLKSLLGYIIVLHSLFNS